MVRYKAKLVEKGYVQKYGSELFALVAKMVIIWLLLALVLQEG